MKKQAIQFSEGFAEGFREIAFLLLGALNFVLLALVYFTVLAMTSISAKVVGKGFLNLTLNHEAKSYWEEAETPGSRLADCLRQF